MDDIGAFFSEAERGDVETVRAMVAARATPAGWAIEPLRERA